MALCPLEEVEQIIKSLEDCIFTIKNSDIDLFDAEDLKKASLLASNFSDIASKVAVEINEIEES